MAELHDHPACNTDKKHHHEQAYGTNSAGGEITEGCLEHYNERIVADDSVYDVVHTVAVKSHLNEYVVMSEVLGRPRCRRRR